MIDPRPADVAPAIAIDGPAGAGKSTVARALAQRFGFFLLDTGAIYRTLALHAVRSDVDWSDGPGLGRLAQALPLRFEGDTKVWLGTEDVTALIRTPEISQGASKVSAHPEVRGALLDVQRRLARQGGCVAEGRDIGTVVLPDAPVKIFLTAKPEVRARRRCDELAARGIAADFDSTLAEIIERDRRDSERAAAPLKPAADSVTVDTSDLSLSAVIDRLADLARKRLFPQDFA